MFDWNKYFDERLKRNHRTIPVLWLLWVVFTVCIGVVLANVPWGILTLVGGVGYALACVYYFLGGQWWNRKEQFYYDKKTLLEGIDVFVKEHNLEKEWKEFTEPKVK